MPRTPTSPLGPRRQIGCEMTAAQRELLAQARKVGWSKQEIATQFVTQVSEADIPSAAAWGTGERKTVVWRLSPETIADLKLARTRTRSTYPLLLEAATVKAIATPKST